MEAITENKIKSIKSTLNKLIGKDDYEYREDPKGLYEWFRIPLQKNVAILINCIKERGVIQFELEYVTATNITHADDYIKMVLHMDCPGATFYQKLDLYNWANTQTVLKKAVKFNKLNNIKTNQENLDMLEMLNDKI